MLATWLENKTLSVRRDVSPTALPAGEARIRLRLGGICATDLEMVKGYYPFTGVLGHEFVGEVVEAPSAPEWVGQRVVGEINTHCGDCPDCRAGRLTHCINRTTLGMKHRHGAFAETFSLPVQNLQRVPDNVSDEAAVFTEPLAAALEIQQQVHIHPSDRVLVIGAGRLGQLIAQTLALTGCELQVAVNHARPRALLEQRGIATLPREQLSERQADIVVESSGSPAGFTLAQRVLRPGGTLVLKSTHTDDRPLNLSPLVVNEFHLVGSRCGPFAPALRLMSRGLVDPTVLVSAEFPLQDALAAFGYAAQPGALKVLLRNTV